MNFVNKKKFIAVLGHFFVVLLDFSLLQLSSMAFWNYILLKPAYALVDIAIITVFILFITFLINNIYIAEYLVGILLTVYSLVNVYVIEFHGSPLIASEFVNARTALDVVGSYSLLNFQCIVYCLAILLVEGIQFCIIMRLRKNKARSGNRLGFGAISIILLIILIALFYNDNFTNPVKKCWHFKQSVGMYGYPVYFMVAGLDTDLPEYEAYSKTQLGNINIDTYKNKQSTLNPDIILILNESFCNLNKSVGIETDIDLFEEFYSLNNSISGDVIVPKVGGGTNQSEFELLTGNSMYLLQGLTPFMRLDMSQIASLVTNLKECGYYTIGAHSSSASNYNRFNAYEDMGFDEIRFQDDFEVSSFYGKREVVTDEDSFNSMIEWYEKATESGKPIFSYLLTIQNHGGWDQNESELDSVHMINNQGIESSLENQVNEYLSCVDLSIKSFYKLISYYEEADRDVIICMVGDHAPSFVSGFSYDDIALRSVPYIIWANFPLKEYSQNSISMNELAAILLEEAKVEKIPYFQYIYEMNQEAPILTSYGRYMDGNGYLIDYESASEAVNNYFLIEYDNLLEDSSQEWFHINGK